MEHFGRVAMACSTAEEAMLDDLREAMAEGATRRGSSRSWRRATDHPGDMGRGAVRRDARADGPRRMHVSPTLVVADFYTGNWPAPTRPDAHDPGRVREAWGRPDFRLEAMTDEVRALAEDSIALDRRTFLMAHRAGVPILASTDASFANPYLFHGFSLLDELDLYVAIGLTPREALYHRDRRAAALLRAWRIRTAPSRPGAGPISCCSTPTRWRASHAAPSPGGHRRRPGAGPRGTRRARGWASEARRGMMSGETGWIGPSLSESRVACGCATGGPPSLGHR
jgi:hypothetical protein